MESSLSRVMSMILMVRNLTPILSTQCASLPRAQRRNLVYTPRRVDQPEVEKSCVSLFSSPVAASFQRADSGTRSTTR